jgi:membrane-associated progesterone receptor component
MAERTTLQRAIGYAGMVVSAGIGVYVIGRAAHAAYRAQALRKLVELAEAETAELCANPRVFEPSECAPPARPARRAAPARARGRPRAKLTAPYYPRTRSLRRLAKHDGKNPRHCLFIAVRGRVLDVHLQGSEFYGPGGPYKHLAGKDGSRALALMSLKAEDATDDLTGLTEDSLAVLDDWAKKLYEKYPTVGRLAGSEPAKAQ